MTATEAFQLSQRFIQSTRLGLSPSPMVEPPYIPGDLYLPSFFLWLCFGRGIDRRVFQKALYDSEVIRKGAPNCTRVYQVASVRGWLQVCNTPTGFKRKNEPSCLRA